MKELILVTCFIFFSVNFGNVQTSAPEVSTKISCQYDTLKLDCERNHIMSIVSANYGRTDVAICGLGGDTECYTPTAYDIVKNKCEGIQSCSVVAHDNIFGDPCTNTIKYLEVSYICVEGTSSHG